jgi:hypothetical protein
MDVSFGRGETEYVERLGGRASDLESVSLPFSRGAPTLDLIVFSVLDS